MHELLYQLLHLVEKYSRLKLLYMASVTLMLKENKVDEKGEMPLYIRMIKGRKAKFISLGIKVHPNLWNQEKLRVKRQYPHSGRVNALIGKKLAEAEAAAIDMEKRKVCIKQKDQRSNHGQTCSKLV
jgi:hypothetical protein